MFAKKSRKQESQNLQAIRQQELELARQQRADAEAYRQAFDKRNAGLITLQNYATDWLDRYSRGVDVADLNPALNSTLMATAANVTKSMQFANKLGNNAMVKGDRSYQDKLNSVATREIYKNAAQMNEMGLLQERANQTGILAQTTNALNADRMAGLGLYNQSSGMNAQAFDMTNTLYQNAVARSNMMTNMLFQGIGGGLSAFSMAGGFGGLSGLFGGGGGASGGSAHG